MEAVYGMTMTIAAMAVLCTLLEFVLPKGGVKASVAVAVGLVFLLVIAAPILKLLGTGGEQAAEAFFPYAYAAAKEEGAPTHREWLTGLYEQAAREGEAAVRRKENGD